jgi:hypothetical protein
VITFSGIVCMAPFWLRGIRGKKSTPSIGWEVSVRSHRLESESGMKRMWNNDFKAFLVGYNTHVYICIGL